SGAYGDVLRRPRRRGPVRRRRHHRRVVVQTQDAEGAEGVSSTTVFAPMATVAPPSSLVTLPWTGRTAKVLAVSVMEDHGLGLPEHVELSLE
ncbi:hypothetical protein GA0074692_6713, partial [Micromonospora pallida]